MVATRALVSGPQVASLGAAFSYQEDHADARC